MISLFLLVSCETGKEIERKPESFPLSNVHLLDGPFKLSFPRKS
jgi:hypothetical protein